MHVAESWFALSQADRVDLLEWVKQNNGLRLDTRQSEVVTRLAV